MRKVNSRLLYARNYRARVKCQSKDGRGAKLKICLEATNKVNGRYIEAVDKTFEEMVGHEGFEPSTIGLKELDYLNEELED